MQVKTIVKVAVEGILVLRGLYQMVPRVSSNTNFLWISTSHSHYILPAIQNMQIY